MIVKDVIGYEGLYQISRLGEIISLPKKQGRYIHNKYKVLNKKLNKRTGYYEVCLCKDKKLKTYLLHRLLAIHFIDNPNNLPQVNHLNGIKTDLRLENLEWVTKSQNSKHAFDNNLGNSKIRILENLRKINQKKKCANGEA